ncbi:MAG: hypothetical protein KDD36_00395 [Flavobacteriales bacterium]|nr:hypothetical protein [Flavobacteriales bacterium]
MKKLLFLTYLMLTAFGSVFAQDDYADTTNGKAYELYVVIKNDGTKYVGKIISDDARELLLETEKVGQIYIPKHEIKEVKKIESGQLSKAGEFIADDLFATRYFISTNGLPVAKGESYILWNLYGPDFQFAVSDHVTVGVLTSWFAVPIIGSVKYSASLSEYVHVGVGGLLGTLSYIRPSWGMALPYGTLTLGNKRANISVSGGYGGYFGDGESGGRALFAVAGLAKINTKFSFVFDSFIIPPKSGEPWGSAYLFIPGLRIETKEDRAFQFGFAGATFEGETAPIPIPMIQWFRKF